MTGSYWSARPADVLSNLVTRRGYSSQCQLLLHVLSGYKANLSEEVKIWERRPAPPALSDPDGSEKGQTLPTGF